MTTSAHRTDRTHATLSERSHFILFPLLKYFSGLPSIPVSLLMEMRACCLRCHPKRWVFSTKSGEQERRGKGGGGGGVLEQGFMTFNTICIIACISCSVSTQCQHGWSVLISGLRHIDKRTTCRYKAILLPTAHVKLFRRPRQAGSCCSCMNGHHDSSRPSPYCNWSGEFIIASKSRYMHCVSNDFYIILVLMHDIFSSDCLYEVQSFY